MTKVKNRLMPDDADVSISKKDSRGQSIAGRFLEEVKTIDGMPENFDPAYFGDAVINVVYQRKKKEEQRGKESREEKESERLAKEPAAEETKMVQDKKDFEKYLKSKGLPGFQVSFSTGQARHLAVRILFSLFFFFLVDTPPLLSPLLQEIFIHLGEMKEGEKVKDYIDKWKCGTMKQMNKRAIDAWKRM